MDVDVVLDHKADMPKAVDIGQLVPIRRISIVDIEGHGLADLVAPAADYHQQGAYEHTAVLVAFGRLGVVAVGRLHPV